MSPAVSSPHTIIKKLHDSMVMGAVETALLGMNAMPDTHYVKELIPRAHDNGWVVILEPRALHTPPAV